MKKIIVLILSLVLVLSMAVVVFADENGSESSLDDSESSLVTNEAFDSYEGLPDFPTKISVSGGKCYAYPSDYVLVVTDDGVYWLFTLTWNKDGIVYYRSDTNGFNVTGTYNLTYTDGSVGNPVNGGFNIRFRCDDGAWVRDDSSMKDCSYTVLGSSSTIYTDRTGTEVFTKSAGGLLLSGLSSTTIVKMTTTEVVGLVPLVIGLATSALALRKGLRMLSQALARA